MSYDSELSRDEYRMLATANEAALVYGVELHRILNFRGNPNWTVCPECRVDDFAHVEGCAMAAEIERRMLAAEQ
jgi:hypothetical protein